MAKEFAYLGKRGDSTYQVKGANATKHDGVFAASHFTDKVVTLIGLNDAKDDGRIVDVIGEIQWLVSQMEKLGKMMDEDENPGEAVVVYDWKYGVGVEFTTVSSFPFTGVFLDGGVEDASLEMLESEKANPEGKTWNG